MEVDTPKSSSTFVRRQLGRRLRRLREAAGKTERDVETAKLLSRTKLWRIESGRTVVKVSDVRALCWLYGANVATTDALAALALGTADQGWWEEHGGAIPDWFGLYMGLETAVDEFYTYDPELVHGLLQTRDYALAVYRAGQPVGREEFIRHHVKLRMERQLRFFSRTPPPRFRAVLGAGVLARHVGGQEVMAAQIRKLRQLIQLDHVDIRVLPWEAGAHPAMSGAFDIFEFEGADDPSVVYLETHLGARYLEKSAEVDECRRIFNVIDKQAVPLEEYLMGTDTPWIKAARSSGQGGNCVEVRRHDGKIQVRDSKDIGAGPILTFTRDEWEAFLDGARKGEFDL